MITVFALFSKMLVIIFVIVLGIFIRCIANIRRGMWTESYALLISKLRIHACCLCCFASSMIDCKMWIGSCVLDPGSAAQLFGERIGCVANTDDSLSLMIFVKIFLTVSRSVMGCVMLMLCFQSRGLDIGYIVPSFHSVGSCPVFII